MHGRVCFEYHFITSLRRRAHLATLCPPTGETPRHSMGTALLPPYHPIRHCTPTSRFEPSQVPVAAQAPAIEEDGHQPVTHSAPKIREGAAHVSHLRRVRRGSTHLVLHEQHIAPCLAAKCRTVKSTKSCSTPCQERGAALQPGVGFAHSGREMGPPSP